MNIKKLFPPLPVRCYSDRKGNVFPLKPSGSIIHFISNKWGNPDNPYIIEEIIKILTDYKLSYHFIIDRDGTIYQLVDKSLRVWHAGASRMNAEDWCNNFCYGVALISTGKSGKHGPAFTDEQVIACAELHVQELDYGRTVTAERIQGHSTVRDNFKKKYPTRKIRGKIPKPKPDPGDEWPWETFMNLVENEV